MAEIRVRPDALRDAGARARQVGGHVTDIAGGAHAITGGGAPAATSASLHGFHATWSAGVAQIGDMLAGLGLTTEVAAGLYERTDDDAVPGA